MEPIRGINAGYSAFSNGLFLNPTDPSSNPSDILKNATLSQTSRTSSVSSSFQSIGTQKTLPDQLSTVVDSARALEEALGGTRNLTYSRSSRQDRIMPPDLPTKRTMVDPRETTSSLAGAVNMPRIQSGTITINNTVIPVNSEVDSFTDVIARINNSTAGVSAYYDPTEDTLQISSRVPGKKISIMGDTSNFLEEANIVLGTYVDSTATMAFSLPGMPRQTSEVLDTMNDFVNGYNEIMKDPHVSQEVKSRITENTNELVALKLLRSSSSQGGGFAAGSLFFDSSRAQYAPITYDLHNSYAALKDSPLLFTGLFTGRGGYTEKIRSNIMRALDEIAEDGAGENINVSV